MWWAIIIIVGLSILEVILEKLAPLIESAPVKPTNYSKTLSGMIQELKDNPDAKDLYERGFRYFISMDGKTIQRLPMEKGESMTDEERMQWTNDFAGCRIKWSSWDSSNWIVLTGNWIWENDEVAFLGIRQNGKVEKHWIFNGFKARGSADCERWILIEEAKKGSTMTKYVKEYFEAHKDTVFTVALIVLLDHFILGGALRDKIKAMVEKLINGAEKKLLASEPCKKE